ncbi:MAG: hypothetical protein E2O84_08450 [Bacteroidetes bacterium]|nr:MAG: hypothetical protein E2O84_08450 [Bacteroidota bacterium]
MTKRIYTAFTIATVTAVCLPAGHSADLSGSSFPVGLDHVNIAVNDLASAKGTFEALGFTIKPGRLHNNSIDNLHLKFQDGTELELITASSPLDKLAKEYIELIAEGDGAAFVAMRASNLGFLSERLEELGIPITVSGEDHHLTISISEDHELRPIWFVEESDLWIDQPGFTTHANGAQGLIRVWFASGLSDQIGGLFQPTEYSGASQAPLLFSDRSVQTSDLEVPVKGRAIVGVTIRVASIDPVESLLEEAGIEAERTAQSRGKSLLVPPESAHGVWLEFLEPGANTDRQ